MSFFLTILSWCYKAILFLFSHLTATEEWCGVIIITFATTNHFQHKKWGSYVVQWEEPFWLLLHWPKRKSSEHGHRIPILHSMIKWQDSYIAIMCNKDFLRSHTCMSGVRGSKENMSVALWLDRVFKILITIFILLYYTTHNFVTISLNLI